MPSERWLCLSISTRKHSPSEIVLSFLSKWFRILRHTFFSPMRVEYVPFSALILLVLVLHSSSSSVRVRILILVQSSEVMLAADPILLGQNMRFRSFISIRPFINNLADGHAYSLEMIKG